MADGCHLESRKFAISRFGNGLTDRHHLAQRRVLTLQTDQPLKL